MHLVQALCLAHDGGKNLEEVERAAELAVQAQRIWESSKDAEKSCNFNTGSSCEEYSPMMMICGLTDGRGGSNAVETEKALARVVQVMLETVEDVNHKSTRSGHTPLIRASESGHLAVVELLLKHENIKVNLAMNGLGLGLGLGLCLSALLGLGFQLGLWFQLGFRGFMGFRWGLCKKGCYGVYKSIVS